MTFEQKFETIAKKVKAEPTQYVWRRVFVFSLVVLVMVFAYQWLDTGKASLRTWNKSYADGGMILIGLSFVLSSICYFWNFADTKIIYRKDLGMAGFYMVLVHGLYSMFLNSHTKWYEYFNQSNLLSVTFALGSIVIFAIMALNSNKFAVHELGGKNWRRVLRTGYIAYIFALVHTGLQVSDEWIVWVRTWGLPPLSMVVVAFGVLVILLRIILFFALLGKKEA